MGNDEFGSDKQVRRVRPSDSSRGTIRSVKLQLGVGEAGLQVVLEVLGEAFSFSCCFLWGQFILEC